MAGAAERGGASGGGEEIPRCAVLLCSTRGRQAPALFLPGAFPSGPATDLSCAPASGSPAPALTPRLSDPGTEKEKGVDPGRSFGGKPSAAGDQCVRGWSPTLAAAGKVKIQTVPREAVSLSPPAPCSPGVRSRLHSH